MLPTPSQDDLGRDVSGVQRSRRAIIGVLVGAFILAPAVALLSKQGFTGKVTFLFPATLAFVTAFTGVFLIGEPARLTLRYRPAWFAVIVGLGVVIFAVGGMNWLTALAVVAAAFGHLSAANRIWVIGIFLSCALGLVIGLWHVFGYGNTLTAATVPALAGLLAYLGSKRNALVVRLHETRAELARMAVAEERLRIARDLHDLLGHSLSLITLKAELAGRLIGADPDRAAREVAGLEAVARKSLADVRGAVSSYRQPVLAAELAAARQMLSAAGIGCEVHAPASYDLPAGSEAALAWAVREGTTNVVRHSSARNARITVAADGCGASVEIVDDGVGTAGDRGGAASGTGPAQGAAPGSGLAGISERATRAGGQLSVGTGSGGEGFRLHVRVPAAAAGRS